MNSFEIKKYLAFVFLILFAAVVYAAPGNRSGYVNNEMHRANKLDENNVPIDPGIAMQTLWRNVRINGVTKAGIPNVTLEKITVVKFHWAGAWIAWTDKNGYHEPTKDDYIPWKNFPPEISDYYAQFCLPEWKREMRVKTPFTLRTPQYHRNGKLMEKKYGHLIKRRGVTGLLCPEVSNNVYVPFSEFPLYVRTIVGFWENESYIPEMPVLEKTPPSIDDDVIFVASSDLNTLRVFNDGTLYKMSFFDGQKTVKQDVFVKRGKKRGRLVPNHQSDLHVFKENHSARVCTKCNLSDHISDKYFNYMFDRQVRNACPVKHKEFAMVKKGTKKVGNRKVPMYQIDADYDKKNDPDSVRLQKEAAAAI